MTVRKPKRPCNHPGCRTLTDTGLCQVHARDRDRHRGSASSRGYGHAWRKAREGYLRSHPICRRCRQAGKRTAANVVDHIIPHRGDQDKFWDYDNWQALCKPCHDRKTATEDGGFGNK